MACNYFGFRDPEFLYFPVYTVKRTLGGMFKSSKVRPGQKLKTSSGIEYILAQVGPSHVAMISLSSGNRFKEPILCSDVNDLTPAELVCISGHGWADYLADGKRLGEFFTPTADIGVGTFLRSPTGIKYLLTADGGNCVCTNMTKSGAGAYYGTRKVKNLKQLDRDEISSMLGAGWKNWEVISADQVLAA